jgi:L-threonylcarbamoyladenylate synthase
MLELIVQILSLTENSADKIFSLASDIFEKGGIIAYPTESFYALGVLAADEDAVRKLFELKKRQADKPLPLIVGDMDTLLSIVKMVPDQAGELINTYWPGPLTLLFEANEKIPLLLTGGTGKVAVRIPGESTALDLAKSLKLPITATSANLSASPPAVNAVSVIEYFGNTVDLIIDAGGAPGGRPSTILDVTVTPPRILREGRVILDL